MTLTERIREFAVGCVNDTNREPFGIIFEMKRGEELTAVKVATAVGDVMVYIPASMLGLLV